MADKEEDGGLLSPITITTVSYVALMCHYCLLLGNALIHDDD